MDGLKELTVSVFGWTIAFVLPGLLALYAIALWSPVVAEQLSAFSRAESNAGLFLLVMLTCLLIGLELSALRWLIFERWLGRNMHLKNIDFANLQKSEKFTVFLGVVDQHYRYHQFFGGLTLVIPFFILALGKWLGIVLWSREALWLVVVGLAIELITILGAKDSYRKYVERANTILS